MSPGKVMIIIINNNPPKKKSGAGEWPTGVSSLGRIIRTHKVCVLWVTLVTHRISMVVAHSPRPPPWPRNVLMTHTPPCIFAAGPFRQRSVFGAARNLRT